MESGLVCKLERSLYGLKQTSCQWNVEFTLKPTEYGFVQLAHDHYLFVKHTSLGPLALLVYVDDILVIGPSLSDIQKVKNYLHAPFTIKDIGGARYFLGLEIAMSSCGLYVAQTKYVMEIIKDTGLMQARSISTSFPQGLKLSSDSGGMLPNPDSYKRLVGRLLYLGFTCSDISHSIQQLSQYLTRPYDSHWQAALHVIRYLKGCSSKDLGVLVSLPIDLFCDNKVALYILANPVFHERTKHIELDCHLVRDAYKKGFISPSFVCSSFQLADIFTTVLPLKSFALILSKLGLVSFDPGGGGGAIGAYLLKQYVEDEDQPEETEDGVTDPNKAEIEDIVDKG
ncbi:UNVERIFIED_CONTAM: Retrovirus-related Pol polyprotein from transposon RE2 [Sesamum latifolium]|uniref:Retrovirus-related Pol polyprotein from transposon RE2 n=1 Tax=Sesamum latifolium TaxID=2727402 RepID=A0AAW2Y7Y8_9LAMI